MADQNLPNINVNVNTENQIKLAQQQRANKSQPINSKTISQAVGTGFSKLDTTKFIEEINKSAIFQKISSSLTKLVESSIQAKNNNELLQSLKNSLTNIEAFLKASNEVNKKTDQTKKYQDIANQIANNSFFKDLFTNIDNINLYFKRKAISENQQNNNSQNNIDLTNITDNLNNISLAVNTFSEKIDSINQILLQLNTGQNTSSLTKDDLIDVLKDFQLNLSNEDLQSLENIILSKNSQVVDEVKNALISIKLSLPPIDVSALNDLQTIKNIDTTLNNIYDIVSLDNSNQAMTNKINASIQPSNDTEENNTKQITSNINNQIKILLQQNKVQPENNESSFNISLNENDQISEILQQLQQFSENFSNENISQEDYYQPPFPEQVLPSEQNQSEINTEKNQEGNDANNSQQNKKTDNQKTKNNEYNKIELSKTKIKTTNNEQLTKPQLANTPVQQNTSLLKIISQPFNYIFEKFKSFDFGKKQNNEQVLEKNISSNTIDNNQQNLNKENNQISQPKIQGQNNNSQIKNDQLKVKTNSSNNQAQNNNNNNNNNISQTKNDQLKVEVKSSTAQGQSNVITQSQFQQQSKALTKKQISIDSDIKSLDKKANDIIEKNKTENKNQKGYKCSLLDGQNAQKFIELVNSDDEDELREALQMAQVELAKLLEDKNNKEYAQYIERIDVYIQTIQEIISIIQQKIKKVIQKQNTNNAIEQLQNMDVRKETSVQKSINTQIDNFLSILQDSGSQPSLKIESNSDNKLINTSVTQTTSQTPKISENISSQTNSQSTQEQSLSKLYDSVKTGNQTYDLYCKKYINTMIIETENNLKSINGDNYKLSVAEMMKYGQLAKANFISQLNNNKLLFFDNETKSQTVFDKKIVSNNNNEVSQEDLSLNKTPKIQKTQNSEDNSISVQPVQNTNQSNDGQIKMLVYQTTLPSKAMEETKVKIKQANKNSTSDIKLSQDTSLYDFSPHTDNEDYNNQIINLKTNYIMQKHEFAEINNKLTKDYDKKSSSQWDEAYKNGNIIQFDDEDEEWYESFKSGLTSQLKIKETSVAEMKKEYNATDKKQRKKTAFQNEMDKNIDKFLDLLQQAGNQPELKIEKSGVTSSQSANEDNIKLKNIAAKPQINDIKSSIKQTTSKEANNLQQTDKNTNSLLTSSNIQSNQKSEEKTKNVQQENIQKYLKTIAEKTQAPTQVSPVYIPVAKDGIKVGLL